MKKIILLFALIFVNNSLLFAQKHSCCLSSATEEFAALGNEESFRNQHLPPLPLNYEPSAGKMIKIKTPDGTDANVFYVSGTDQNKNKTLLLFQEWWGLNDYIKREAEHWAKELGVNVMAPDLYDGNVAATSEDAAKFMQALKEERARAIISGCIDYCGPESKLQTIGWCMGGGWSLQAALMAGNNAKGCVIYYGMPEKDRDKLAKLKCPVLGIFAKKDERINPEVVKQFEESMRALGKTLTVYSFDADHAFANPSNPKHDKDATEQAHDKAAKFLKENFKL